MEWSKKDIARLDKLFAAGVSYEEIGRRTGRTRNAVKAAVRRFGIIEKYGVRRIRTKKTKQIKTKIIRYNPNPVTYDTRVIICCSAFRGESLAGIAKDIQRPAYIVEHILRQCIKSGFYRRINLEQRGMLRRKKYQELYLAVMKAYERVPSFI